MTLLVAVVAAITVMMISSSGGEVEVVVAAVAVAVAVVAASLVIDTVETEEAIVAAVAVMAAVEEAVVAVAVDLNAAEGIGNRGRTVATVIVIDLTVETVLIEEIGVTEGIKVVCVDGSLMEIPEEARVLGVKFSAVRAGK